MQLTMKLICCNPDTVLATISHVLGQWRVIMEGGSTGSKAKTTRKIDKHWRISKNLFPNSFYILECPSIIILIPWPMAPHPISIDSLSIASGFFVFRVSFSLIFIKYQSYLCWLVKFEHNFHLNFNLSFNLSESFLFSNIYWNLGCTSHYGQQEDAVNFVEK